MQPFYSPDKLESKRSLSDNLLADLLPLVGKSGQKMLTWSSDAAAKRKTQIRFGDGTVIMNHLVCVFGWFLCFENLSASSFFFAEDEGSYETVLHAILIESRPL